MSIKLSVPGTQERFGTFVCELGFDDFVKVQITKEGKKGVNPYFYLARRKDVENLP